MWHIAAKRPTVHRGLLIRPSPTAARMAITGVSAAFCAPQKDATAPEGREVFKRSLHAATKLRPWIACFCCLAERGTILRISVSNGTATVIQAFSPSCYSFATANGSISRTREILRLSTTWCRDFQPTQSNGIATLKEIVWQIFILHNYNTLFLVRAKLFKLLYTTTIKVSTDNSVFHLTINCRS